MVRCHGQDHSRGERKQGGKIEKEKGSRSLDTHSTAVQDSVESLSRKAEGDRKQSVVLQRTLHLVLPKNPQVNVVNPQSSACLPGWRVVKSGCGNRDHLEYRSTVQSILQVLQNSQIAGDGGGGGV